MTHMFHRLDNPAALAELQRLLVPGGWLAILSNGRDLTSPVQAALDDLLGLYRDDAPSSATDDWREAIDRFTDIEQATSTFGQDINAERLTARGSSVPFVARLDDRTQARVLDAVRSLFDRSPTRREDDAVREDLAYVCEVRILVQTESGYGDAAVPG